MTRAGGGLVRLALGALSLLLAVAALLLRSSESRIDRKPPPAAESAMAAVLPRLPEPAVPPLPGPDAADTVRPAVPRRLEECREVVVFLPAGTDPAAFGRKFGLVRTRSFRSDPDAHVFAAKDGLAARAAYEALSEDGTVRRLYFNPRTHRVHCAFTPNDPFFNDNTPAGFHGQWHLGNGASATHANVVAAWTRDITGNGVVLGIVDDCLETGHEDLAPNYVPAHSWNFGQDNNDPNPGNPANDGTDNEDRHGTSVAGVAAARGGNGIGVSGAAPLASLAGLRIDFEIQTSQMFADATLYHSSGADTRIKVKNHSYGYTVPFVDVQLERDALTTSAASGTIHVLAAGNERGFSGQDSNKQDLQSSPDGIAVAAVASNGTFASYSSFGANVFVAAPSNGTSGFGILTTDRTGVTGYNPVSSYSNGINDPFPDNKYTSTFGGTSSASPLVAGILALAKEVQPNLTGRFAKHLLVRTSKLIHAGDASTAGGGDGATAGSAWKTNAAGWTFNENYGFGLIDADALTQAAVRYSGVTALQTETTGTVNVAATVPNNNQAGITRTFVLASTVPLEEMLVTLNVTHGRRGDLEAHLTSPAGTVSRLAIMSTGDTAANMNWTFSSNAFWGETPAGTWSLRVRDLRAGFTGTWNSYAATARMGMLSPTVRNVTSPVANGTYGPGASIPITIQFSAPVAVTGVPQLTLETGAVDAVADYAGGSGTDTLTFLYVVGAGDQSADLQYVSAAALSLNGGTIRDAGGMDADRMLPAPGRQRTLGANKDIIIDGSPPAAGIVDDGWAGPDLGAQASRTSLAAHWSGFSDPETGIAGYEWAIGTTSGGQEVQAFTPVGLATATSTAAVNTVLALATGTTYFVTVRATNGARSTTSVSSDGVMVTGTDAGSPAVPTGLGATPGDTQVLLQWDPAADAPSHSVWWKPASQPWIVATPVEGIAGISTVIPGLTNGIAYDFMLKAVGAGGNESSGVFASATPAIPVTLGGVGYGTIQAAINAAAPGQSVIVGPGTFAGALTLRPGVSLVGISAKHTIVTGSAGSPVITVQGTYLTDPVSTIGSLSVTGGSVGVSAGTADVLLDHVILHHLTSHGASSTASGRLRTVNCTILSNGGDGIVAAGAGSARNCIAGKNGGTGLNLTPGSPVSYNDAYLNPTADLSPGLAGVGNLSIPAEFVDEAADNFVEVASSPTVDAGDPSDAFALEPSPNGARINQGAFGNTALAAGRPPVVAVGGGGGGGGGCGATGVEAALLLLILRRRCRTVPGRERAGGAARNRTSRLR